MLSTLSTRTAAGLSTAIIRDPLTAQADTLVQTAIAQMQGVRSQGPTQPEALRTQAARSSCVLVLEADRVIGMFTERDVVRLSAQQQALDRLTLGQVMTPAVMTLRESALCDLFTVIALCQQYRIRHLPILDDQDHLAGLVTYESLPALTRPLNLLRLRSVTEVMTRPVVCASPDDSLLTIAQRMVEHRISCVVVTQPVVAAATETLTQPIGIVTERDFVHFQSLGLSLTHYTAAMVMSTPVFSISPEASLWTVQQQIDQYLVRRLVVTGTQGELLGIVTQTTVLTALNPLELYNLADGLATKVKRLEADRLALLENRAAELEQQVAERTAALQAKEEQAALIRAIALQIRSSRSLPTILETAVTQVRQVLACDRVLIYQFDPDGRGQVIAESVGTDWPTALGNTIVDTCFQTQASKLYSSDEPIVVDDLSTAGYSRCHLELLAQYQVKANVVVPVRVTGQLWGLLLVHHCADQRQWRLDEVTFLQEIAVQLAIAIQQAMTHQQLQAELAERQQAELDRSQAMRSLEALNLELEKRVTLRTIALQERLAFVLAENPAVIFTCQPGGDFATTFVSENIQELTGYSATDFLTEPQFWAQRLHPEDAPQIFSELAHLFVTGSHTHEYRFRHQDGSYRWMRNELRLVRDEQGQPVEIVGYLVDIHDRKQLEAASEQENAFRQQIVDNMTEGLCVYYAIKTFPFVHFTVWNPQMQVITGYSVEEINRLGWYQTLYPDPEQQAAAIARMERMRQGEHLIAEEWEIQRRDGQRRTIAISTSLFTDQQGQSYVLALIQDITDRQQAELERQQLVQELSTFKSALDQAAIVAITNAEGVITYVNDRFCEISGYTRAELLGQTHRLVNSGYHPAQFFTHLWQTISSGQVWRGEICNRTKEGCLFWLDSTIVPFFDTQGRPERYLAIRFDITARKLAEVQINQQLAAIEAAIDGIAILQDNIYLYANRAHLEMFGYDDPAEVIGQSWQLIYSPDEITRFEAEVFPALIRDRAWEGEAIATRKS